MTRQLIRPTVALATTAGTTRVRDTNAAFNTSAELNAAGYELPTAAADVACNDKSGATTMPRVSQTEPTRTIGESGSVFVAGSDRITGGDPQTALPEASQSLFGLHIRIPRSAQSLGKRNHERSSVVFTVLASSAISSAVCALIFMLALPGLVDAQVARTTAQGLTVASAAGLEGITADVRPTGGGILSILGVDGKTARVSLGAGGGPAGQPTDQRNGGMSVYDVSGKQIVRIGTIGSTAANATGVQLSDSQGNVRYRASLDADGTPTVQLLSPDGEVVWSAP